MDQLAQYLPSLLSVALVVVVGAISPGPDFAMVVRNSLVYSRKSGLAAALGVSVGLLVHVTYTLLGIGIIIAESTYLLLIIKYCGSGYLFYIGCKGLLAKKSSASVGNFEHAKDITITKAFVSGFLTSILNPKTILFFVSILSAMIDLSTPPSVLMIYAIMIFLEVLIWFSFVAFCLSGKATRMKFYSIKHWIERATGAILIALALRILL